jgi:hypothetical protein
MRLAPLCILASCLLGSPVAIAADGEREEKLRGEAMQDRDQDRDKGRDSAAQRQHWLYDEKNQPETTGSATTRQNCKSERVRVPRGDGTTTVTRIDKCQ